MEVLSWLLFAAVTCLATLVPLLFKRFCSRRRLNRPPGPKRWPVIGNLHLINYLLPHQSLHELSRKYGPIMQLQFGSYPVVVASSPEMARQFLKIHDLNFVSRPETSVGRYISFDNGDIVWSPYGPYWRYVRKICLVELFSAKRLDSFEYIRIEELHALLFNLYASCGKPVTLRDHLSTFTLNNLTRLVFGKKYLGEFESKGVKKMMAEWLLLTGVINIGDLIPWIDFLDLQGYLKRMKALRKEMDSFFEQEIDEHIARRHDDDQLMEFMPKDMLELLLKLADDPNPELKLSQNNVKGITWDLLVGGTDTSATITEWAMSELLKQQDVFKQATEELDRVIGRNRWVTEEDIPNLPCIKSIVHETMRMHPAAPLLVPHLAREDCEIHGYDIVRGTRVLINAWSIGRDPTLWDAPNEFRPERFIGRDIDAKGQHFELLPFGSGRRMCPGLSLGLKFIETGLANLIHGFTWKLPNQMEPQDLNMEEVFGIVVQKKVPLIVVAEPRLPDDLYSV